MEVELEAGLDGVIASEVLADGTFIADPGAKAALGPGLARKVSGRAVELSELSEDAEMVRKWCSKALEALDATGYETARVMDLIAALRAAEPVLNLKRCGKVKADEDEVTGAMLMSKQNVLRNAANTLRTRAEALRLWSIKEDAYVDSVLDVRRSCGGVGRDLKNGMPIVDCGGSQKLTIRREGNFRFKDAAFVDVDFTLESIGEEMNSADEELSIVLGKLDDPETESLSQGQRLVRLVRCARAGDFRRSLFARFLQASSSSPLAIELGTRTIALECGPSHTLRIREKYVEKWAKREPSVNPRSLRSKLLRMTAIDLALSDPESLDLEKMLKRAALRESVRNFESSIDAVCKRLQLRPVWARSDANLGHFRVRVFSTEADADGPPSIISTFEACEEPGQVLVTPAFGAIVPSSDVLRNGGEDVPGSFYTFVLERELTSILCPLLCIRLLETLEACARTNESSVLDVDRHGFSLTVQSMKTGRTIRSKVWPGGEPECPVVTALLDGVPIAMPTGPERIKTWKELLHTIVTQPAPGS